MTAHETVFNHRNFEVLRKGKKYFVKVKGDLRRAIRRYAARELERGKQKLDRMKQWSQKHRKAGNGDREEVGNQMDPVRPEHFDLERSDGKAGPSPFHTQINTSPKGRRTK